MLKSDEDRAGTDKSRPLAPTRGKSSAAQFRPRRAHFAPRSPTMALSGDVASNISADADATAHKRKHEDSISQQDQQEDSSAARNKQIQTDLLQVLERYAEHHGTTTTA